MSSDAKFMKDFRVRMQPSLTGGRELEVSWPSWSGRTREIVRIGLSNPDEPRLYMALPGRGGTFNLSYDYRLSFPARGTGEETILRLIKESHGGMDWVTRPHPAYVPIVARIIDIARRRLLTDMKKERDAD